MEITGVGPVSVGPHGELTTEEFAVRLLGRGITFEVEEYEDDDLPAIAACITAFRDGVEITKVGEVDLNPE